MTGFSAKRLSGVDDPFLLDLDAWSKTPFQTRGFLAALAGTTVPAFGAELILVGVEDAGGNPVALFPFTLIQEGGLAVAEAVGLGSSDYFIPPTPGDDAIPPEDAAEIWSSVLRMIPEADIARLRNVPLSYDGRPHSLTAAKFLTPMGHCSSVLPIDRQEKAVGGDAGRKLKKLERLGQVQFVCPSSSSERVELLDAMFAMRKARFSDMGRTDYLEQPGINAFYRQLASDPQGIVRIAGLMVDGEILAVVYGLLHKGRFTLLIPTMTSEKKWQACSPGLVAMHLTIEHGRMLGWHTFDFSVGELQYKSRFGAQKVDLFEVQRAMSLKAMPRVMIARLRSILRTIRLKNRFVGLALRQLAAAKRRLSRA